MPMCCRLPTTWRKPITNILQITGIIEESHRQWPCLPTEPNVEGTVARNTGWKGQKRKLHDGMVAWISTEADRVILVSIQEIRGIP